MSRYLVVEVGCLECSFEGTADPEVVARTDSLEIATASSLETGYSRQVDRFVVDTQTGELISPNSRA